MAVGVGPSVGVLVPVFVGLGIIVGVGGGVEVGGSVGPVGVELAAAVPSGGGPPISILHALSARTAVSARVVNVNREEITPARRECASRRSP